MPTRRTARELRLDRFLTECREQSNHIAKLNKFFKYAKCRQPRQGNRIKTVFNVKSFNLRINSWQIAVIPAWVMLWETIKGILYNFAPVHDQCERCYFG